MVGLEAPGTSCVETMVDADDDHSTSYSIISKLPVDSDSAVVQPEKRYPRLGCGLDECDVVIDEAAVPEA